MSLKCDGCKDAPVYRLTSTKTGWLCDKCHRIPVQLNDGVSDPCGRIYLNGYGWESKSRWKEMKRRVILPIETKDGGYFVGRRSENGKIFEKEPDY